VWAEALRLLLDVTAGRLSAMDEAGRDVQVLSLNAPGIQAEKDASVAVSRAKAVNDLLAETIANNPDRFAGFAALPLQDPQAAAKELERAVEQLGLKGALVNAHTQGRYLDDPALRVLWEYASGLDVPLYLHPATGVDTPHVLSGHPELTGPLWSWGNDTASHILRLVFSKVFGGDHGVISNGSPVFRDEHGLGSVQAHHRADLAGVKSLKQRRDHAFGFSRE
jgi:2,3-dihydroxybenzoate decarboxylase